MKITKILKFGGSSVGTLKMIKKVGEIVGLSSRKENIAVVVSAFQGVTDQLLKCAELAARLPDRQAKQSLKLEKEVEDLRDRHVKAVNRLAKSKKSKVGNLKYVENLFEELKLLLEKIAEEKEVSDKNLDWVASFGERMSAYIVAASMRNAYFVDARELVKTDDNFVNAAADFPKTNRRIQNYFRNPGRTGKKGIPIITGFLGSTMKNETTTLGRGGSDYSASIFGAALGVRVIEIWTDVDGIMSADPRLVKSAKVLPEMSYEEAIEMAYFGAKVIHPATMLPAIKKGIPILIKNTFNPAAPGTWIKKEPSEGMLVKGITAIDDVALISVGGVSLAGIPGSAARIFKTTAEKKVNVILISQASSEHTVCFGIKSLELEIALKALKKEFVKEIKSGQVALNFIPNQSILAMVSDKMRGITGVAGRLFQSLGNNGINISAIAQGGSERNVSFVVDACNKIKALNVVHNEFFEGGSKNIFLAGAGNIGGELLKQIYELQKSNVFLKVCGIMDVNNMVLDEKGINLGSWKKKMTRGEKPDLEKWISGVKLMNLPNKVFVDCTASEQVVKKYLETAEAGFHIVTPNKKFNVLPMKDYRKIREIMKNNKRKFLYETNVGAALPIISTIRDLLATGDRITKIEGIFSGTLSFIFNSFGGSRPFSEVVAEAKELGYTEPDPREDLNGNDVGRKLLVLAREIGLELEMKDVKIENLMPSPLHRGVVAEFLKALPKYDSYFKKRLENAKKKNKVLRYVARLERGKAAASLQAVSMDNPLAAARSADNIFAFYTKRYNKRPLVVQGPGAGREVTAGGVLADILKI